MSTTSVPVLAPEHRRGRLSASTGEDIRDELLGEEGPDEATLLGFCILRDVSSAWTIASAQLEVTTSARKLSP